MGTILKLKSIKVLVNNIFINVVTNIHKKYFND